MGQRRREGLTGSGVPDAGGVVSGAGGHAPPIRTEGGMQRVEATLEITAPGQA